MRIAQLLKESEQLTDWFDISLNGVELKAEMRSRLAGGCLDIALEHHRAIITLISQALYGSAFSLVRSLFEAYVRGVWLHRSASDADLERFKKDTLHKEFGTLIRDLEKIDGFESHVLSATKTRSWDALNSYTHSGYLQIVRRNTEATIEPNYAEDEMVEVLDFVNAVGLLSALETALLSGNKQLACAFLDKAQAFGRANP
jgi:hypothetical protein